MKEISPVLLEPLVHLRPLTDAQARTLSLLFTASYVGSIYVTNLFASSASSSNRQEAGTSASAFGRDGKDGAYAEQAASAGLSKNVVVPPISATDADGPVPLETMDELRRLDDRDDSLPKPGDRNHPDTIKRRITGVTVATGLSLGAVWYVVAVQGGTSLREAMPKAITLLGLRLSATTAFPSSFSLAVTPITDTFKALARAILPYALAPGMLLGPLYATYLDGDMPLQGSAPLDPAGRSTGLWGRIRRLVGEWSWVEGRNYIAGPVSEELVFRSSLLAVGILARQTPKWLIFGTPLYFGIAHAHHAWNVYSKARKEGATVRDALIPAAAGCVFQLTYTSLFGFFASYTHIRTGSVIPALASHVFCNVMGIYMPTTAIARHPSRSKSIVLAYIGGIAAFVWGVRRL